MRKLTLVLIGVAFVLATAGMTYAGMVNTEQSATSAKQIRLSGEFDVPMVSRDKGANSILDGVTKPNHQDSDNLWSPSIILNIGIDVGDKISSLIQLQNRRLGNAVGTAANQDFFGGGNVDLGVEQAFIKMEKFMIQDLTFIYGMQNLKTTLRDGEGAFFLDTNNASSNMFAGLLTNKNGAVWCRSKASSEFAGFRFDYGSLKNSNYQATLFFGKVSETATGVDVLHNDTMLQGVLAWFKPNINELLLNGSITQFVNPKADMDMMTIGLGGTYNGAVPNLGLYGEFYTQTGAWSKTVDQAASAYRLGGRYDVEHELKPYVDFSMWMLSGGGTGTKNKNFLSMENVKSTMILEDDTFGLDLDSNYTAMKLEGGIATKVDLDKDGVSEDLKVKLLFGNFTMAKAAVSGVSKKLGTEIDLVGTLQYNPSTSFSLGYATLSGATFFTDAVTYNAKESSMGMIIFGANMKF